MKKLGTLLLLLSVAMFTVGCTDTEKEAPVEKKPAAGTDGGAGDGGTTDGGTTDGGTTTDGGDGGTTE